ncbi:hypothetical protein [Caloranaerobacter sp. DY30410]|uniref:hypothetical protein n=1 Tax=Caloranaerobacter sp. DY30410 TaxID=3238305 RepID=UPI003D068B1F
MDITLVQEYLADICKGKVPQSLIDEVEFLYEEIEDVKKRLECLEIIGNIRVIFDDDIE